MQGNTEVIDALNGGLTIELTAINQYFLHSRMYKDWGITKLAAKEYEESIDEMKHADLLIGRILLLEGLPNMQDLGKLKIGEDVPEILVCDLSSEVGNQSCLKEAIAICESLSDFVSREIFEQILEDTEEHIDWIGTQQFRIKSVGLANYLQEQMGEE